MNGTTTQLQSGPAESGLQLINFTGGTRSNADYTIPEMGNQYVDSRTIYNSIVSYEEKSSSGLNGFILLIAYWNTSREER